MIFVTGDTHGSMDIHKLSANNWELGKQLTKNDYLIILGDFGMIWSNPQTADEKYWLNWLNDKPWTTLFVDGNHDNHELLQSEYITPVDTKKYHPVNIFNGIVGQIENYSVYHLRRGYVYSIDNKKIFVMGGASSVDKATRIDGKSWWKDEIPTYQVFDFGLNNLEHNNNLVDYVLTHTCSDIILKELCVRLHMPLFNDRIDAVSQYLNVINEIVSYENHYCGHFHTDTSINKTTFVYDKILQLN